MTLLMPHRFTEPATVEHLDEDWAVPCQRKRHQGGQPAQWIVWSVKCCDRMLPYALWCTPCMEDAMRRMASYDRECPHCGHLFAPAVAVVRLIEPLNRRTT